MKTLLQVAVMVGVWLTTLAAFGQFSPFGGPFGGPPGGGPPGGDRYRGSSDRQYSEEEIKSRLDRSEAFLREMDKNGNGILEPDEVPADRRRFLEFMASRGGYEFKLPMAIAEMRKHSEDYYRGRVAGATPGSTSPSAGSPSIPPSSTTSSSSSPKAPGPSVYGFVPGAAPPSVSSFGGTSVPATGSTGTALSSSSSSRYRSNPAQTALFEQLDSQTQQRIRDLASAVIRKYDKNGNGRLEKEEWPGGRLGTFDEANRFGGSTISPDELLVHFADYLKRGQLPSDMAAGGSSSSFASASSQISKPKSGRFLSASERLPKGLPSWFLRLDLDGDGQVTMAEFTRDWSPETAAQFDRYDLNHDGVITPEECLKVERTSR
jgi:Ca2+-binding EF-hand superfamily protein